MGDVRRRLRVSPTLLDLLGGGCSVAELGRDDRSFLVAATGRRSPTVEERRRLGARGGRLLLS